MCMKAILFWNTCSGDLLHSVQWIPNSIRILTTGLG
jgi:hypothetical protein